MTNDQRCRLRDIAKRVCEHWGNELKRDPSAFIPINERPHSSFTDEECATIFASWIKHQDEYAIDGVERESVTPFVFPPGEDEDEGFPVSGSVIWGLLCINRDVLATPETLQRGKSWLVKQTKALEPATGNEKETKTVEQYRESPLGKRDKWIYEQKQLGRKNHQVIVDLEKIFSERGWEHLETAQSIRASVNRWTMRTGAAPLPPDQGGRPKSQNPKVKTAK